LDLSAYESGSGGFPLRQFTTTRWSVVVAAGRDSTVESRQALETLCETYWQPLYFFVRHRGHSADEAEDLIQGFFLRLLEKGAVEKADRERGRFRTFLLSSLKNYLVDEWRRTETGKRGGGQVVLSLDFDSMQHLCGPDCFPDLSPDLVFARRWAVTLIERTLDRLREAYRGAGNEKVFKELKPCMNGDKDRPPYRKLAGTLDMTEGAVKMAVHRLRQRFRDTLREEIAQTVADPSEIDDELQALFFAFD
jgi:RNA polymerase sigma-70 factor (ECF subfamily)